ncbi:MAG: protein kinase, partial [Actinomycetota bacterium]
MVEAKTFHGRYRLAGKIAAGGMGSVYTATDERLSRRVALKLLRPDLAEDPRFVERFRREARAAAALSHPNIAGVFDYGQEEGHHFIVMELVDGPDLARLLREEGPFEPDRAIRMATEAA